MNDRQTSEPIAWRWKYSDTPGMNWICQNVHPGSDDSGTILIEPLYAAPQPASLRCDRCGSSGDTFVLCAGCHSPAMTDRTDALRKALEPLARIGLWQDRYPDGPDFITDKRLQGYFTAEQVRSARAALAPQPETEEAMQADGDAEENLRMANELERRLKAPQAEPPEDQGEDRLGELGKT